MKVKGTKDILCKMADDDTLKSGKRTELHRPRRAFGAELTGKGVGIPDLFHCSAGAYTAIVRRRYIMVITEC